MSTAVIEDFCITSDRLNEWKEVLPKAGPKFRLGKYFDTIYEIPEFDAIKEPEGGYLSCWDTDTDINTDDESSNNFLFASIDGDSASVICVDEDEAFDLIRRWKAKEIKRESSPVGKITDQELSTKPGSDGTYEVVDGDDIPPEEHIYESIEDCAPEYQLYIENNENSSPLNTPTHVTVTQRRKSPSPSSKTKRSNSLPISSNVSPKFVRKYSDCSEYTKLRRRQSSFTDKRPCPGPGVPPPLPPPNSTNTLPSASSEYSQLFRLAGGKVSFQPIESTRNSKSSSPPEPSSMILKHKGRSYVLPITEKGRANKEKVKRQASYHQTTPKHIASSTNPSSDGSTPLTPGHRYPVSRSVSMGFQNSSRGQNNSPPAPAGIETTPKRKSKHNSSHSSHNSTPSSSQPNSSNCKNTGHVTLYGVL